MILFIAWLVTYIISVILMSLYTRLFNAFLQTFFNDKIVTRSNALWFIPFVNTSIIIILTLFFFTWLMLYILLLCAGLLFIHMPRLNHFHKEDNSYGKFLNWLLIRDK